MTHHKARLVAKGYSQRYGIDYEEVFAPVARFESIRVLMALAAQGRWELHHLDVKSAFLNGEIEEEIYVKQPEGFVLKGKEQCVFRLKKALYGLKQAPRAWYFKLDECLSSLGFRRSEHEHAVYFKKESDYHLLIGVYVDDLIVTGPISAHIKEFKVKMMKLFEMSDLGLLNSYLGIEVIQGKSSICLNHRTYAMNILEQYNMTDCNLAHSPMEARLKFVKSEQDSSVDSTLYRSLIGSLRYLTHTRPDLMFSVGFLSRFMEHPTSEHMLALKRVLRYIKGTLDYGLVYKRGQVAAQLIGYTDSDYAGDIEDRKSTMGHVFFYNSMAISWTSQKQKIVALSTCEAEYIAITAAACQGIWLSRFITELKGEKVKLVTLKVDNKSAIDLSRNPVYHSRSKHIDTRYHFIRSCVEEKLVKLEHVKTEEQLADGFTKALGRLKFVEMRVKLGLGCAGGKEQDQGGE